MTKVIIGDGITNARNRAFFNCRLTEVELNGMTNLEENIFSYSSLTSVRIPASVTQIRFRAFAYCSSLATVIFEGNQPTFDASQQFTTNRSTMTVYSNGWANSTTMNSDIVGSTTVTFITGVPLVYKKMTTNGYKIQVDSAVRDGDGNKFDVAYQKKNLLFTSKSCSSWASDNTYTDYPYKGTIALTGVTASDVAWVIYDVSQADSGDYAPVCETYAGGLYIWSNKNTSITIPTILIFKG